MLKTKNSLRVLQSCAEVLEALRERQLGEDQQRASEAYRAACHDLFPHCLLFSPAGLQDNGAIISTNGDASGDGEHDETANEM